jgi:hypothetical protein
MPLAPQSIVDPGEVQSRAPLKKSTVGWAVAGVVLLALVGVFGPKLFTSSEPVEVVKAEKPVGVGQTRQIDGEFDEAARRARQEAAMAATTPASGPLPTSTVTAPVGSVVPPEARREGNTSVLYGKQVDAVTPAQGACVLRTSWPPSSRRAFPSPRSARRPARRSKLQAKASGPVCRCVCSTRLWSAQQGARGSRRSPLWFGVFRAARSRRLRLWLCLPPSSLPRPLRPAVHRSPPRLLGLPHGRSERPTRTLSACWSVGAARLAGVCCGKVRPPSRSQVTVACSARTSCKPPTT